MKHIPLSVRLVYILNLICALAADVVMTICSLGFYLRIPQRQLQVAQARSWFVDQIFKYQPFEHIDSFE